jgi:hypothetical protein
MRQVQFPAPRKRRLDNLQVPGILILQETHSSATAFRDCKAEILDSVANDDASRTSSKSRREQGDLPDSYPSESADQWCCFLQGCNG